ncbi:helix-turn-helix domain-containing protein [bacterium]|nr:helix-turn-helix domain-containing protein [bacterium]
MAHNELVQSLLRSLDILQFISRSDDGVTIQQLADTLGLKSSTAYNLVRTLTSRQFLEKTKRPTRYQLGSAVVELSNTYSQHSLLNRSSKVLKQLFKQYSSACFVLSEVVSGEIMLSLCISPERPGIIEQPRAKIFHAYGTASALLFQAFWTEEERIAYRKRYPFWEFGAHLWKTPERLDEALEVIRQKGYSAPWSCSDGIYPVAAPIIRPNNEIAAAFGGSIPNKELKGKKRQNFRRCIVQAAKELSKKY